MGRMSKIIGNYGEDMAVEHLQSLGYKIIERNFRSHHGEIDIIAEDGEVLVFVEVKNYSYRSLGAPQSSIRKGKRESIIHAARSYLHMMRIQDKFCRFDVLTVFREEGNRKRVELIKDAFRLS